MKIFLSVWFFGIICFTVGYALHAIMYRSRSDAQALSDILRDTNAADWSVDPYTRHASCHVGALWFLFDADGATLNVNVGENDGI